MKGRFVDPLIFVELEFTPKMAPYIGSKPPRYCSGLLLHGLLFVSRRVSEEWLSDSALDEQEKDVALEHIISSRKGYNLAK